MDIIKHFLLWNYNIENPVTKNKSTTFLWLNMKLNQYIWGILNYSIQDFIISSGTLYNQNICYLVLFIYNIETQ